MQSAKFLVWASAIAIGAILLCQQAWAGSPAYLLAFPHFAERLSPDAPGDVDGALKRQLEQEGSFPRVQRLFDLYAWQLFLAINWPLSEDGSPAPGPTAVGRPRWTLWSDTDRFRPAPILGSTPGQACSDGNAGSSGGNEGHRSASLSAMRVLRHLSTLSDLDAAKISQARRPVEAPLIDQNGNFVYYESLIDPNQIAYLCAHGLTTTAGEAAFALRGERVDFPAGRESEAWSGAFSVKLAWKVIDPGRGDRPERFFTLPARILDADGHGRPFERIVTVGLVGMHVVHKAQSAPQRIWATFEQVDNLGVDLVNHPGLNPSFYNLSCPTCVPNTPPPTLFDRTPVQVARTVPIATDTESLNAEAEAELAQVGSVWQYYKLIGVQWPTIPNAPPASAQSDITERIANHSGGMPTPIFLSNAVMETYIQPIVMTVSATSPESIAAAASSGYGTNGRSGGAGTQILAGESCMSCHAAAGIVVRVDPVTSVATLGPDLSGDFSFFLSGQAP